MYRGGARLLMTFGSIGPLGCRRPGVQGLGFREFRVWDSGFSFTIVV